jgi:DNA-binding NarL/FixJ family response regulator
VLVCDDAPELRSLFAIELAADGDIEIVGSAADGEAAADLALALDPHVVVLDLGMPRLTGLELIRRLTAQRADMAFVVVTGSADAATARDAILAGAASVLSKRASAAELRDAVRAARDRPQGAADRGR